MKIRDFLLTKCSEDVLQGLAGQQAKVRMKALYELFRGDPNPLVPWAPLVWNRFSRPRVSFCMWLACWDRLPLKTRLFKWGLVNDQLCVFYQAGDETRDHVFCTCSVIVPLLRRLLKLVNINQVPCRFDEYVQMFHTSTRQKGNVFQIRAAVLCSIIDKIWTLRNAVVFRQEQVQVEAACRQVCSELLFRFAGFKSNRPLKSIMSKLQQF